MQLFFPGNHGSLIIIFPFEPVIKEVLFIFFIIAVFNFASNPFSNTIVVYASSSVPLILSEPKEFFNLKFNKSSFLLNNFANNNAAAYGLFTIIFAVLSGFLAATLFRRY